MIGAYLAGGRRTHAEGLIDRPARAHALPSRWPGVVAAVGRARLAQDDEDPRSAGAAYARALGRLEKAAAALTRAWALTHHGAFLARGDQSERGRAMLADAAGLAEGCGAAWHAARARAAWRRAGGRRRTPPGELTPREAAAARLARAGRTNRQIAQQLVLSVNTVETPLANVYRKLGIQRRWQLIASPDPDRSSDQPSE